MASLIDRLKKRAASGVNVVRDVFDANTQADQQRRIAQGKPQMYKDEVAQRKGVLPKLYGQQQVGLQNDVGTLRNAWRTGESKTGALAEFALNRTKGSILGVPGMVATGISGGANKSKGFQQGLESIGRPLVNNFAPQNALNNYKLLAGNTARVFRPNDPRSQRMVDEAMRGLKSGQEYNQYIDENTKSLNPYVKGGLNAGGMMLSNLVTPLAGANSTAGQTTKAAIESGASPTKAMIAGYGTGIVDYLGNKASTGSLLKTPGKNFAQRTLTRAVTGGADNLLDQFSRNLIAQKTYNPDQKLSQDLLTSIATGAGMNTVAGSIGDALTRQPKTSNTSLTKADVDISAIKDSTEPVIRTYKNNEANGMSPNNPVQKRLLEVYNRNMDAIRSLQKNQGGTLGDNPNTPTIKNVFGEEVPNPAYKAPQVGKTDISNAENFVKGRSLQEFNNFLTVNNGSAKKSQIIQEIKSQYGSTENFWRVMNGKEQTKSFARGELGLNSQPTLKKPVAQVGKTDPKFERDINTGKMKMVSEPKPTVKTEKYSIANSDISRTISTGMNQDGFTVEDWGGKKRFVSLDGASTVTKVKVRKAEAEYEAAKKANNGTALAAKQRVNDAYSDAIQDLKLQDYATTESGGRTFNSRYNDWLETKYKDRNIDTATIKDMAANPQKYRSQFEAETSTAPQVGKTEPITAYHGSDTKIDKFDISKTGTNTDSGMFGKGIYFSGSPKEAGTYARKTGNVEEYSLDIKNPYVINSQSDIPQIQANGTKDYSEKFTKYLQDNGYDGVIDNISPNKQYVVFNPKQISKSVAQVGKTLKETRTNTTGIKNYNPDGLPKPANQIVHDYASMLESMGSGQGVAIVDGKRISNNSPAYRELYAQLGRKPTSKDWYDYAYNEINNGKAPQEIMGQFENTLNSELMTDKNIQAPEALNPQGSTPVKNKPSDMPVSDWESLIRSRVPDQRKVDVVNNNGNLEIQKKTVAPITKNETIQETVKTDAIPVIKDKPDADFQTASNKYLGSIQAADTTARALADTLPAKLKGQDGIDAIIARENGITTGRTDIDATNAQLNRIYDNLYAQYKDAGFDMGYVDNYSPRIYKNPKTGEAITKDEYLYLTRTPGQTISRTAQNVNPEHLLYKTPQELLAHYVKTFERAKAGREYFDNLKNRGFIVEAGTRPDGMVVIDAPGMPQPQAREVDGVMYQGNYYARPEVANKLNKIFGVNKGNKVLQTTAKLASVAQDVGLSGGIPGTPVNAFTFAQMTKELTAGKVRAPFRALWESRSAGGASKYVQKNADVVKEMGQQGIRLNTEYSTNALSDLSQQIADIDGKSSKAAVMWDKVMGDPTFKRFMPTLQIETYKQIKNKYVGKLGEQKASELAGQVVKNFYGLTDLTTQATRSANANNLATTVLFAPKYRESMVRFWVNNAKAIDPRKWTNPEYAMNVRFNVGATLLFAGMQAANIALNGSATWDNPDGKKDKLIIPADALGGRVGDLTGGKDIGVPFLSSIATVPRAIATGVAGAVTGNPKEVGKSAKSFLGYGIRPLVDVADNENYFGSKVYDPNATGGERAGSIGSYLTKAYMHPYLREGLNVASNQLPENVKKFVGAKDQTAFETGSKALESPLRFYDPNYYEGSGDKFQSNTRNVDLQSSMAAQEKKQKEVTKQFEKSFSKEDLKLFKKSADERAQLLQSGAVDQQKLDGLDRYALAKRKELGMKPGTIGQTVPDKIDKTDDKVKEFYNDRAYVHDTDYETWQSSAPDSDSAKDMIRRVNQIKPEGLPDIPQTNKVAELYADFKKEQSNNNWSESFANKKKIELLRNVYKTQLDKEQSFWMSNEVSDDDIRTAVEQGDLTKDMLDELVAFDDLMDTLKGKATFGKTLRKDLGYNYTKSQSKASAKSRTAGLSNFSLLPQGSSIGSIATLLKNARI